MSSLWLPLLLSSVIWAEEDYFHISPNATWDNYTFPDRNTTWDEARDHCQKCFKELTTITSRNVHLIVQEDASLDYWIGLRRSYNGTVSWSKWSNGKPVTYQNWYPGHPVPNKEKKMIPRCFSTTETPPSTLITTTTQTSPETSPVTTLVTSPETSPETSPVTSTVTTLVTSPETSPVTTLITSPETSPETSTVTTLLTSPKTSPETFTVTTLVTFPETSPVTSTVTSTVTSPEISPETSPETFPETSPETFPETSPETSPPNTPEDTCPILTGILDCLNITYYDLEDVVQNCTCVKPQIVTPKTTTDCTTPHATTFSTIFSTTTSGTTTESTTSESTTSESTTTESTTLESTTLESTTLESTTTESTMTESTMSESTTTESTTASNCIFEPEPDPDVYIEDACVVLLSYGMWKEINCNESQYFICYDEHFIGEISITNVTTRAGELSWSEAPGNITHYRVIVTGNQKNQTLIWRKAPGNNTDSTVEITGNQSLSSSEAPGSTTYSTVGITGIQTLNSSVAPGNTTDSTVRITGNPTNQTFNNKTWLYIDIENLTPGNLYSVQVIPVKCGRDLNPQNISFYTIPSSVENLTVVNVTTYTVSLKWSKPEGNYAFYKVAVTNMPDHKCPSEECTITGLTPGNKYEFIVRATVNETTYGVPNNVSNYTKPSKVVNLTSLNDNNTVITASWEQPLGNHSGYRFCLYEGSDCTTCENATNCSNTTSKSIQEADKTDGTKYCLCVAALTNNDTLQGEMVGIPAYTLPNTVDLSLDPKSDRIEASWTLVAGHYQKFIVTIETTSFSYNKTNSTKSFSYTFLGLKAGVEYKVTVITVNGDLTSTPATKSIYTFPTSPSWVNATSDKTTIYVQWGAPKESTGATIEYKVDYRAAFWNINVTNFTNSTSITYKNLNPGTRYDFNVRVVTDRNMSLPVSTYAKTEPEKRTLILTMLCSSQTPLQCESNVTQTDLLKELNETFYKKFEDSVHWKLKWVERKVNNP